MRINVASIPSVDRPLVLCVPDLVVQQVAITSVCNDGDHGSGEFKGRSSRGSNEPLFN